ncbi:MAG TPA: OmpH family outer membrane protein [Trueperaceae bacterium]|nr:OmpH family outer membrane protein [Trueperaceae bacterium]
MNRILITISVLLTIILASTLIAQETQTNLAFVDSQALIAAHPAGIATDELRLKAQEEIDGLKAAMQALREAVGNGQPTVDQQNQFVGLNDALIATQQKYQKEIGETVQPALVAVDTAIREVAQENGYTIVLDRNVAGGDGINLVVYADTGLDITDLVIERIRTLE